MAARGGGVRKTRASHGVAPAWEIRVAASPVSAGGAAGASGTSQAMKRGLPGLRPDWTESASATPAGPLSTTPAHGLQSKPAAAAGMARTPSAEAMTRAAKAGGRMQVA